MKAHAVVLGDSFNNTLGLVRSLGRAGADVYLILIGEKDRLFLHKSRFVKKRNFYQFPSLEEAYPTICSLGNSNDRPFLIASNDHAAEFIDTQEEELNKVYRTPMSGSSLGELFEKDAQLKLAKECGVRVPNSVEWHRGEQLPDNLTYPILTKPINSNSGSKSDIHICRNKAELSASLNSKSLCNDFLFQEYIEKDYELNLIGISTDHGVVIPGAIKKIRHYPTIYSPCSFGCYYPIGELGVDIESLKKMIERTGYCGPFSIELLKAGDREYFMEVNFRHDGLAYTATKAGINLLDLYINDRCLDSIPQPKKIFMMDLSTDYCHVKDGNLSKRQWFGDFLRTRCQLNFDPADPMPTIAYHWNKIAHRAHRAHRGLRDDVGRTLMSNGR